MLIFLKLCKICEINKNPNVSIHKCVFIRVGKMFKVTCISQDRILSIIMPVTLSICVCHKRPTLAGH